MFYCSIYWEVHHPNWWSHIFQRGWLKPPTSQSYHCYLTCFAHWCPIYVLGLVISQDEDPPDETAPPRGGQTTKTLLIGGDWNHGIFWVNYNELTTSEPWKVIVRIREIIPFYGRTIQVSELLQFAQNFMTLVVPEWTHPFSDYELITTYLVGGDWNMDFYFFPIILGME